MRLPISKTNFSSTPFLPSLELLHAISHAPLVEHPAVQALIQVARELPAEGPVFWRLNAALERLKLDRGNPKHDRQPEMNPPQEQADFALLAPCVLGLAELARRCGDDFPRFESELLLLSDSDLWDARGDRVSLLTLHASKGLEFPVVFIVGCEDGLLPLRFGPNAAPNLAEERRLFFVGMTRARARLFLSYASKRLWRAQLRRQAISPFITGLEEDLLERRQTQLWPHEKPDAEQLVLFR